ncbi:MAG: cytochrome b N-terminal domain-containing protein [Candidatus Eisenbacteria bacterium]|nr:cytochrome b N-terminal domain-containing protein [Candidatus Eisenbacteria bacterium]
MISVFVKHLFPRFVLERNLRLTYTFCLGGLAFTSFLVLTVTGLLLLFYYRPSPGAAYESILYLESSVWGGAYIRSLHRLSSHTLLVLVALHTLRVIWTGAYRPPREFNWIVGVILLFLVVAQAYTGVLLPLDQTAWWATQTGTELIRTLPFGEGLRTLLVPDMVGGPLSLIRFYAFHIAILPIATLSLSMLHFFTIRKQRGLLPYL